MIKKNSFYLTTAISYVNGAPHLGHAYEAIAADALARFKRLDGKNTFFLTGTDEHGEKNSRSATASGLTPEEFTSRNSKLFQAMTENLNISNDSFIRTSMPEHHISSKAIWSKLLDSGEIYLGKYGGWYSVRDEAYVTEDEIIIGPQNKKLAPSGAEVEWVEESSYFFRLSNWTDRLLEYYAKNPNFIKPRSRLNEVVSFVNQGLKDLSISRKRLKWGIKVPGDESHVMYVWLDALTNYLTGLGYPDTDGKLFKLFWPADIHVIGKDIVRFHAVYWPAFLMAAGLKVPKTIFCHGFLNIEGHKMSKSLGNVVSPNELVAQYGLDPLRYFLLREVPFGQDGSFSHNQIVQRINGDLANDYGNLAQRVLSMVNKYCCEKVPEAKALNDEDKSLYKVCEKLYSKCHEVLENDLAFHIVLSEIWVAIGDANRYVDRQAPWDLKKYNNVRMNTVLYVLLETVRQITILLQPYMPSSTSLLLDQLGVPAKKRSFCNLGNENSLVPGTRLPKPKGVFPRYDVKKISVGT